MSTGIGISGWPRESPKVIMWRQILGGLELRLGLGPLVRGLLDVVLRSMVVSDFVTVGWRRFA